MSRVLLALLCSALLCSALLCSAVSIWRLFHPCQPLFTSSFKILGKAKPQLYRRKAAIPTREISRRFPADRLQLADPMGPCSFAPPACAGFADSILEMSRNVQSGNTQNLKSSAAPVRLPAAPAPTPGTSRVAVPAGCVYRP